MAQIITSRGLMDESELVFSAGSLQNADEYTTWEEWRAADGEIVKRNVHVRLLKALDFLSEQAQF